MPHVVYHTPFYFSTSNEHQKVQRDFAMLVQQNPELKFMS